MYRLKNESFWFYVFGISFTVNMSTIVVSVESPYNNTDPALLQRNINYAILAVKDCSKNYNNEEYAAKLLNTQYVKAGKHDYISDNVHDEFGVGRDRIIELTHAIRLKADKIVFYIDFGYSSGMLAAKDLANKHNIPCEERYLPQDMMKELFPEA
ncbi:MAG: hypothetical protein WD512_02540 [Candidatus Paceibacterota bacterium]